MEFAELDIELMELVHRTERNPAQSAPSAWRLHKALHGETSIRDEHDPEIANSSHCRQLWLRLDSSPVSVAKA
jgi:hypothetical protein